MYGNSGFYGSGQPYCGDLIQVANDAAVDSFPMMPNSAAALFHMDGDFVTIKSTDSMGNSKKTKYNLILIPEQPKPTDPVTYADLGACMKRLEALIREQHSTQQSDGQAVSADSANAVIGPDAARPSTSQADVSSV